MPTENWKDVPDFPGYQVSDQGKVRSYWRKAGRGPRQIGTTPRLLRPHVETNPSGSNAWCYVNLRGKQRKWVHHLVLEAFVGPCPLGLECRHLNDVGTDNRLENLAWGSRVENRADMVRNGRANQARGEKINTAKLKPDEVRVIQARRAAGESPKEIARDYPQIHSSQISRVSRGKSWKHLLEV